MVDRLVARLAVLMATLGIFTASPALCAALQRDVFYTYDALGHQLTAKFDSATGADRITNAYNGFGELISSTISIGGVSKTVAGLFDPDGNRTQATVDGQAFTYAFDGLDRLNNIYEGAGTSTPLDQFAYNADATLHSRTEGTGSLQPSATYGYDGAERLISQSDAFPTTTTTAQSNVGWTFTRNPASELASETRTNDAYAYATLVNASPSYTVNGLNQYTGVGTTSFCYDANGNLTTDGSSVYLYDVENRLVQKRAQTSSTCPTATTGYSGTLQANLVYDPLGRLFQVDKGTSGTTTLFLYDGDALVAEYNSTGATLKARYVHGANAAADDPLVWYTYTGGVQTGKHFLHADHLGSIVAMTNGSSAVSLDAYDEYGIPGTDSTGTVTNTGRFQYTGQIYIPEVGMYDYKARIYSPRLGRFLQTDAIGYEGGINIYEYAEDDPIDNEDPSGNCLEDFCVGETALVAGCVEGGCEAAGIGIAEGFTAAVRGIRDLVSTIKAISNLHALSGSVLQAKAKPGEPKGAHKKGARASTEDKHDKANARRQREQARSDAPKRGTPQEERRAQRKEYKQSEAYLKPKPKDPEKEQ
jgi:RHS repeat-associated protein